MSATQKTTEAMFVAEVWTGDQWHQLGLYKTRLTASRRIERSKSHQEHRVRLVDGRELATFAANMRHRTREDKRNDRENF